MKKSTSGKQSYKIPKKDFAPRTGVQGAWSKVVPDKEAGLFQTNNLIQKGTVIAHGLQSKCKIGDKIIFSDWLVEKITIGDQTDFYVPDEVIREIL